MTNPSSRQRRSPPARAAGRRRLPLLLAPLLLLLLLQQQLGSVGAFTAAVAGRRLRRHAAAAAPKMGRLGGAAAMAAAAAQGDASAPSPQQQERSPQLLSLSLSKPLGLVLEEAGPGGGVVVAAVGPDGSAAGWTAQLQGRRLAAVAGRNVTALPFDAVMELFAAAPDPVALQVLPPEGAGSGATAGSDGAPVAAAAPAVEVTQSYDVGAPVTIKVARPGAADLRIEARVGDNLRRVLLDGGVEVYQGLREKLGNCGGAGQCTFCAVDLLGGEGWEPRSDYEDQKLARFPRARLACLNNIQGPATVQKAQR